MKLAWRWFVVVIPAVIGVALFLSLFGCAPTPEMVVDRCEANYNLQDDLAQTGVNPFLTR